MLIEGILMLITKTATLTTPISIFDRGSDHIMEKNTHSV